MKLQKNKKYNCFWLWFKFIKKTRISVSNKKILILDEILDVALKELFKYLIHLKK